MDRSSSSTWYRTSDQSVSLPASSKLSCVDHSDTTGTQLPFSVFTHLWTDRKRSETQHKIDDKYAEMETDHKQEHNDYAIVETILETPRLEISYYWDEPGACII